jgi:PIN domain nuclease of toxin-antitoxin system
MSLLLDTHVVLCWLADDPTLSAEVKDRLDHEPDVYISSVTVWEVAIKLSVGKIKEPADLAERVRDSGFRELPVTSEHALVAGGLPWIHRDPFDRMLVAQARCADLTLATRDRDIRKYDVAVFDL